MHTNIDMHTRTESDFFQHAEPASFHTITNMDAASTQTNMYRWHMLHTNKHVLRANTEGTSFRMTTRLSKASALVCEHECTCRIGTATYSAKAHAALACKHTARAYRHRKLCWISEMTANGLIDKSLQRRDLCQHSHLFVTFLDLTG